jgi:hypothetical protein
MALRRGPALRDRVDPGREPASSDRHIRTFGADRDFAGALPGVLPLPGLEQFGGLLGEVVCDLTPARADELHEASHIV